MIQRNIIKGAAVHLTNLSTRLKSTTFFVNHTFESGRDLPEARDVTLILIMTQDHSYGLALHF